MGGPPDGRPPRTFRPDAGRTMPAPRSAAAGGPPGEPAPTVPLPPEPVPAAGDVFTVPPRAAASAPARSEAFGLLVRPGDGPPPAPAEPTGLRPGAPLFVPASAVTTVGLLLLLFVLNVLLIGQVRHARDQETAFATLRHQLANGTAPVNQTDDGGHLLPLGTPVAVLDIPALQLREVVLEGTTSGVTRSGPGHRRDTPLPGQAGTSIIFGRAAGFGAPFADLGTLVPGRRLTVTTGQGAQVYRVTGVRRAGDPSPAALEQGRGRLTLITGEGPEVLPFVPSFLPAGTVRVDAELVSAVQPAGPRPLGAGWLPAPERAMQAEPGALLPVVLWAQLLAVLGVGLAWVRSRWGRWQVWLAGMPALFAVALGLCDQAARLLPNLL